MRSARSAVRKRGRRGADPDQGRESGHPPRGHRDPQPDQGRARGRPADRGHQGPRLVGERARRGCARRDRQHQGAAAVHRDAAGRAQIAARRWCAPSARSATRRASSTCCRCCSGRRTRSKSRPSRRSRSSPTSGAPTRSACGCRRSRGGDGTISQAVARAMTELDNRFSTQQIAANQRAAQMQEPSKTLLIDNQETRRGHQGEPRLPRRRPPSSTSPR